MFRRSGWSLGRVLGIPLVIDYSWPIVAVLITWTLFVDFRSAIATISVEVAIIAAAGGAVLFFASVLAHELSHSVLAKRRGIGVRRIRLFIFGGVSEIESEAVTARDEFVIAIGGPLVSLAIGGAFVGLNLLAPAGMPVVVRLLGLLAYVNIALGLFNLVPGFPLDGGRVLRALIWKFSGNRLRATGIAVTVGKVVAGLLVAAGAALFIARGDLGGIWYIAIGWFLYRAAGGTMSQTKVVESLRGVTVVDVMRPTDAPVDGSVMISELRRQSMGALRPPVIPVVVDGRVRGAIDLADTGVLERLGFEDVAIGSVMRTIGPSTVINGSTPADQLFALLEQEGWYAVVADGRFVGSVDVADFAQFLASRDV